ncbi:DUF1173 domain-containing protein [Massilia sp. NR 4-1]|uniref:DUF1173 domain-containing protein n=1 Tax=Massilia sp. NR 4-1 TaxID=1678028 RepID=UPI00067E387C|nr:DUF1173 domain-containing protein [Massilia sp. NR 4-1]AKU21245.1 hypothetical protein ACZ75_06880 [Massilia sp. NR 4-1]
MATYRFDEREIGEDHPDFQAMAAAAHSLHMRPLCLCKAPGLEMYVALIRGRYFLKRMPETGSQHALTCSSYEPPAGLSGLGEVLGSAIRSNYDDAGTTTLRLGFSLSRRQVAAPKNDVPRSTNSGVHQVRSDGARLSLRALLHYLWREANLHRWVPAMAGKRSWYVIRKNLLKAAEGNFVGGRRLADMLYIPESFVLEEKEAITARRLAQFKRLQHVRGTDRPLFIVIGEIKEIGEARYGKKIVFRHLPDCPMMLRSDIAERLERKFMQERELWNMFGDLHLVACGTASIGQSGIPAIEELTLMLASAQWLPLENSYEKTVLERLVAHSRRFEKCLRFNLAADKPLATVVLSDTPEPVVVFAVPPESPDDADKALADLRSECQYQVVVWNCAGSEFPDLPPAKS